MVVAREGDKVISWESAEDWQQWIFIYIYVEWNIWTKMTHSVSLIITFCNKEEKTNSDVPFCLRTSQTLRRGCKANVWLLLACPLLVLRRGQACNGPDLHVMKTTTRQRAGASNLWTQPRSVWGKGWLQYVTQRHTHPACIAFCPGLICLIVSLGKVYGARQALLSLEHIKHSDGIN